MSENRPPKPPTRPKLERPSNFSVDYSYELKRFELSWEDVENAKSYLITCIKPDSFEKLEYKSHESSYKLPEDRPGIYSFSVKAINGDVISEGVTKEFSLESRIAIEPPSNITIRHYNDDDDYIEIEWNESENIGKVEVYKKQNEEFVKCKDVFDSNIFNDYEVQEGANYEYMLRSISDGQNSEFSDIITISIVNIVNDELPVVENLILDIRLHSQTGKPFLSWNNTNLDNLYIERCEGYVNKKYSIDYGQVDFEDQHVEDGLTYSYEIKNELNESCSNKVEITVKDKNISIEPITPITPKPGDDVYDPDYKYFFIYGVPGSGKSVLIGSIIYSAMANSSLGSLRLQNDDKYSYQTRGTDLFNKFEVDIASGMWVRRTNTIKSDGEVRPKELKLKFTPKKKKKEMKFVLMDMSCEDLVTLKKSQGQSSSEVPPGIKFFLKPDFPSTNLGVICMYPVDFEELIRFEEDEQKRRLAIANNYIMTFIHELDKAEKSDVDFILVLSKWDLVSEEYKSGIDFLKEKANIIFNRLSEDDRNVSIKIFTVGNVSEEGFEFEYKYAEDIFKLMYLQTTGQDLIEKKKRWF